MVNFWLKVADHTVELTDAERIVSRGPVFILKNVQETLKTVDDIRIVNTDCTSDVFDELGWEMSDVCKAFQALDATDYRKTFFCRTSSNIWVLADDYVLRNYDDGLSSEGLKLRLYMKFSVNNVGKKIMMLSCHESD